MRVCTYLRVSTARQADRDLSIPDQRRQAEAYCAQRGWTIVREFTEPGASGTDENRPVFQAMIDRPAAAGRSIWCSSTASAASSGMPSCPNTTSGGCRRPGCGWNR